MPKSADTVLTVAPFGRELAFIAARDEQGTNVTRIAPMTFELPSQANYTVLASNTEYVSNVSVVPRNWYFNGRLFQPHLSNVNSVVNQHKSTGLIASASETAFQGLNTIYADVDGINPQSDVNDNFTGMLYPNIEGVSRAFDIASAPGGGQISTLTQTMEFPLPGRYVLLLSTCGYSNIINNGTVSLYRTDPGGSEVLFSAGLSSFYFNVINDVNFMHCWPLFFDVVTPGVHTLRIAPTANLTLTRWTMLSIYDPELLSRAAALIPNTHVSGSPAVLNFPTPAPQYMAVFASTGYNGGPGRTTISVNVQQGGVGLTIGSSSMILNSVNIHRNLGLCFAGPFSLPGSGGNIEVYCSLSGTGVPVVDGQDICPIVFLPTPKIVSF